MSKKIISTRNYGLFELHSVNRDVEKTKWLRESMMKHGWIDAYPLHVIKNGGNKLYIKDGHHRFDVAQELSIPVKYVICNDKASIHEIIKTVNFWSLNDYLTSYMRAGLNDYAAVNNYRNYTGIKLADCVALLSGQSAGSHNKSESFKSGKYKVGDVTHATVVGDIVKYCVDNIVGWANNTRFVQAVSKIVWLPEFQPEVFKQKAITFKYLFDKQPTVQHYMDLIESIYNRHSKSKVPLAFMANEASKRRAVCGLMTPEVSNQSV